MVRKTQQARLAKKVNNLLSAVKNRRSIHIAPEDPSPSELPAGFTSADTPVEPAPVGFVPEDTSMPPLELASDDAPKL